MIENYPTQPHRSKSRLLAPAVAAALALAVAGYSLAQQPRGPRADERMARSAQGSAKLPASEVTITIEGDTRIIHSNGVPDHQPGKFPNSHNPGTIAAQSYTFRMPVHPQPAAQLTRGNGSFFGVALNGVPFEAGTAEFWNGDRRWNYEAMTGKLDLGLDENHAHVQPGGVYHYHGLPTGFITRRSNAAAMVLIGYAADGFPIYNQWGHVTTADGNSTLKKLRTSWRLKQGSRPGLTEGPGGTFDGTFTADFEYVVGSGDLDEANGRTEITAEYPEGTYHYVLTEDFPYLPRFWRGTPNESFFKHGPGPGGPGGPGPSGGRGNGTGFPRGNRPPPPPWFDRPPAT